MFDNTWNLSLGILFGVEFIQGSRQGLLQKESSRFASWKINYAIFKLIVLAFSNPTCPYSSSAYWRLFKVSLLNWAEVL